MLNSFNVSIDHCHYSVHTFLYVAVYTRFCLYLITILIHLLLMNSMLALTIVIILCRTFLYSFASKAEFFNALNHHASVLSVMYILYGVLGQGALLGL